MLLRRILEGISPIQVRGSLDLEISGLSCDSREISPGFAFFAVPGSRTDGARHVPQALEKGAVAVFSQGPLALPASCAFIQVKDIHEALGRAASGFYSNPSSGLSLIGVTGTNGKTTATYFLESIFSKAGKKSGVIGTVNYRVAGEVVSGAPNTTPISLDLQKLLARMCREKVSHVAMEVSSHALALKRVEELEFDIGVFTNFYRDHLDFHGDLENYFQAKCRLFELLSRSSKKKRCAVLNFDDPVYPRLKKLVHPPVEEVRYGLSPECEVRAQILKLEPRGTFFELFTPLGRKKIRLKLIGEHNVYNALAAAAACLPLGFSVDPIAEGLEGLEAVPGRLELLTSPKGFSVFVDYAHTDSALEQVLKHLRQVPHQRIISVYGCGGDRDKTKRAPMGEIGTRLSDLAVLTSDNPRTESPMEILNQVEEGAGKEGRKNYVVIPDRREAIAYALKEAKSGDIVLIAGKGHENYQIFKDKTVHFDDREVVQEMLRGQ